MIDRKQIEHLLKLNGLGPQSPDQEIKELLIGARWHEDDVETALVVLRTDPSTDTSETEVDFRKNFKAGDKLLPETLNAVLGIDVEVNDIVESHRSTMKNTYRLQILSLVLASVVGATLFLIFAIYSLDFKVF